MRTTRIGLATLAVALVTAGCSDGGDGEEKAKAEAISGSFVETVAGSDAYVAIVIDHEGDKLAVKLAEDEARGSFRPEGGEKLKFAAPVADEPAGLYRAEETVAGDDYLGGWIVLPDGTQRGDIKRNGMILPPSVIDPNPLNVEIPTVMLAGGITLTAMRVA